MADDELFFVRERQLDYPVFDSDNHMYENTDAFTKFLPPEYDGIVKYIQEGNRTKLTIKDRISRAIPNPTFQRVAPPGGQKDDPLQRRSIAGLDAFFDVEPRYKLMQEFGITRSLMWPTLASVIEQAMPEDPLATHAVLHALNEWMYEHWTFGYEDAIFPTPAIGLAIVDRALQELEWVTDRGARIVYIRPAPVFGFGGPRSFALPEFDPFWEAMQEKRRRRRAAQHREPALPRRSRRAQRHAGGWRLLRAPLRRIGAVPRAGDAPLADERPHRVDDRPRHAHSLPAAEDRDRRTLQRVDPPDAATTSPMPTNAHLACSTRTRSRCCAATSGSTSSATPTRSSSSACSASPTACSAPTSRIPRACATRSPFPTTSRRCRSRTSERSWAATSPVS